MDIPKYSKLENERRYLVALPDELGLEGMAFIHIEDVYIADSRLRLRALDIYDIDTLGRVWLGRGVRCNACRQGVIHDKKTWLGELVKDGWNQA